MLCRKHCQGLAYKKALYSRCLLGTPQLEIASMKQKIDRRTFLVGAAALSAAGWGAAPQAMAAARAHVVIAGAGAAGLSNAARVAR